MWEKARKSKRHETKQNCEPIKEKQKKTHNRVHSSTKWIYQCACVSLVVFLSFDVSISLWFWFAHFIYCASLVDYMRVFPFHLNIFTHWNSKFEDGLFSFQTQIGVWIWKLCHFYRRKRRRRKSVAWILATQDCHHIIFCRIYCSFRCCCCCCFAFVIFCSSKSSMKPNLPCISTWAFWLFVVQIEYLNFALLHITALVICIICMRNSCG